jgi:mRNA interferase MazF
MAASAKEKIALVKFPFSDLTRAKLRPAVVLAVAGKGDMILCQITSNPYADPLAIEITDYNFKEGSLERTSYIRPGKLFTASEQLIDSYVGALNDQSVTHLLGSVIQILREH